MKNTSPLETVEAKNFASWLRLKRLREDDKSDGIVHFTHVPNETYSPHHSVHRKNTAEGVMKGIPDYLIVFRKKGKHALIFLEMKRQKGGVRSPEQRYWISILEDTDNVTAHFAHGCADAIRIVENYL